LKGIKWLFLWVNVKLGLLAIFGKFIKKMAFAFMHSFMKKLSKCSAKGYIGRGPISNASTPRVSTKPTTNTQSSAVPTPDPNAQASGSGSLHRFNM
jgi:hypothetical protein